MAETDDRLSRRRKWHFAGEYSLNSKSDVTGLARAIFRDSIHEIYPEFLKSLRNLYFPAFLKTLATIPHHEKSWPLHHGTMRRMFSHPAMSPLRVPLLDWARQFNVEKEEWLLNDLLRTLYYWAESPHLALAGIAPATASGYEAITDDEAKCDFEFRHSGWRPTLEKWESFAESRRADFEEHLKSYETRLRELIDSRGHVRITWKSQVEHFDWLVLWQLAGKSRKEILKWQQLRQIGLSQSAIAKGIQSAAELVGLVNLRSGGRGPKRKTGNLPKTSTSPVVSSGLHCIVKSNASDKSDK